MANKMTIAEKYEAIIEKAKGVLSAEDIAFLEDRKEKHLAKNATKKMTKVQIENEEIKKDILETMLPDNFYTCTDIQKKLGLSSTSKASALMGQLAKDGLVVRSEMKGRAYFKKA